VNAVVVARRQVHDGKLSAGIPLSVDGIPDEIGDRILLLFHEQRAGEIDRTYRFDLAVGRARDGFGFRTDRTTARLELTREELIEAFVRPFAIETVAQVDAVGANVKVHHRSSNLRR
jgi:hypothetical protein